MTFLFLKENLYASPCWAEWAGDADAFSWQTGWILSCPGDADSTAI